jgi:hypothetical protein
MKKRKRIAAGLVLLILLQLLAGCANNYNAQLFDDAVEWIHEDFASDNIVSLESTTYPFERVFVIDNQEKYGQVFTKDIPDLTVDFTNQMLIVYTFVAHNRRYCELLSIDADEREGTVAITYEELVPWTPPGVDFGDTCDFYQRWFVVKLDKLDVHSAVFEKTELPKQVKGLTYQ